MKIFFQLEQITDGNMLENQFHRRRINFTEEESEKRIKSIL